MYKRGMGAVFSADGTSFSYPAQCSNDPSFLQFMASPTTYISNLVSGGVSQLLPECQPPTPAQLNAMQAAQLANIAAVNPALATQGMQAGAAATAALAKTDPNAADYYAYQADPLSEAFLGPTATNWLYGIDPTNIDSSGNPKSTGIPGWVWIAAAGFVVLLVRR